MIIVLTDSQSRLDCLVVEHFRDLVLNNNDLLVLPDGRHAELALDRFSLTIKQRNISSIIAV